MTSLDWAALEACLADDLPHLRDGDAIVLKRGNHYVQFSQLPAMIHGEAVSNTNLPPSQQLSAEDEHRLFELGWRPPEGIGQENWWYEILWPARSSSYRDFSSLLVETLTTVFGVPVPTEISYKAFNMDTGESLDLPFLKLFTCIDVKD